MRAWLQGWVRRWWRGEAGAAGRVLDAATGPLEHFYAVALSRRDRKALLVPGAVVPGLRVVSVGNLAVGGTGKTPVASWVVRSLLGQGEKVTLLTRGYGGDEERLHRRWNPGVPVVVDPDRVSGAEWARAQGATVAVLDDGFQHRRLGRDLDLVLLAAEDPWPGRLLPRGPYREPPAALERAHGVIVTRRTAAATEAQALAEAVGKAFPHVTVARLALAPGGWLDLGGGPAAAPQGATLTVAGVARPEAVAAQVVAATGQETELLAYPDHHGFGPGDVKTMRARAGWRTVVVTEKDAVKLEAYAGELGPVRVLIQKLKWEAGEHAVTDLVTAMVSRDA